VVSHVSAGREWGFRRLGADARLHVVIAGQNHRRLPNVVIHRSHRIEAVDVVERPDGIRYTSPPRTVFDLASVVGDEQLESIIEQVLHDELVTLQTLHTTARRLRQRTATVRRASVADREPASGSPVDSDSSCVSSERSSAGLPVSPPAPMRLPSGENIRLDFYWPEHAEALEVDHITGTAASST
jgi:hypothetical protein